MNLKNELGKKPKTSSQKSAFNIGLFISCVFFLVVYGLCDKLIIIHYEQVPFWYWILLLFQCTHITGIVRAFK